MHKSKSFRPSAVAASIVVAALLLPIGHATAQRPLKSSEVWCLDPDNRARVVATAELNGSGGAYGADRARIIPAGSEQVLNLQEWRRENPDDFESACRATFSAFREDALTTTEFGREIEKTATKVIDEADDDLSTEAQTGIATGTGLLTALIGLFGGYQLSQRSRAKERRYSEADALDEELSTLEANVDALRERTLSGTARPADYLTTRQLAVHLRSRLPSDTRRSAQQALTALIEMLGSSQPEDLTDAEAAIGTSFVAVQRDVTAVAAELRA